MICGAVLLPGALAVAILGMRTAGRGPEQIALAGMGGKG